MLALSHKVLERIKIGDNIYIQVLQIRPGQIRVGIEAPEDITIIRDELNEEEPEP